MIKNHFEVIVVGGGHAGIEAAHAAAKLGSKTLLISLNVKRIGIMSCNPAIGGVGKGHIVYEVSALGGLMPKLCTKTYIQARTLNTKKGPAVQGLRLQIDKPAYSKASIEALSKMKNLTIEEGIAQELISENKIIKGIKTREGNVYYAPCVVLTTGTFLNGITYVGRSTESAGREGEESAKNLTESLQKLGLETTRLKTGTPPRLLNSTIDFSHLEKQKTDKLENLFEFYPHKATNTHDCYLTSTNKKTHEIILKNKDKSPIYQGDIKYSGPRYCPSIEAKLIHFPDKKSHLIFIEPESASSDEIYPNGISTSLPFDVQEKFIRSIVGFENAIITRPGYAIEYDLVLPQQLKHTLEAKTINGLFLAGQINGTTGYEEAAGQGIIAGINAHLKHKELDPFIIDRNEGYIGVMIDDLVSLGVDEPYRMFTSRAERRLILRQDNSFLRLTPKAYKVGMIEEKLYKDFLAEKELIFSTLKMLREKHTNNQLLKAFGEITCDKDALCSTAGTSLPDRVIQIIYAEVKYHDYLGREYKEIERTKRYMNTLIPSSFPFKDMPGLSTELQEKLMRYKPENISQASLIPGMTPAAVSLLIFKIRQAEKKV